MSKINQVEEELEPQYGLPEILPKEERVLWQGKPNLRSTMERIFLFKFIAAYFFMLISFSFVIELNGLNFLSAVVSTSWNVEMSIFCLIVMALMANLICTTTVYTVTDKRVVMRIGILLTLTFNIPFKEIDSADLKTYKDETGDISLKLKPPTKIAFVHLWPHCRFISFAHPCPTLRCVSNATESAQIIRKAWLREIKNSEYDLATTKIETEFDKFENQELSYCETKN